MNPKDEIDVLLKEYALLRAEIQTYIALFHRYTNMLPVIMSTAVAIGVSILLTLIRVGTDHIIERMKSLILFSFAMGTVSALQLFAFLIFILIITSFLFTIAASLGYIHNLEVLAVRCRQIEEEVNRLSGRQLMNWEIKISPNLIRSTSVKGLWVMPSTMRLIWNFLGMVFLVIFMLAVSNLVLGAILAPLFQAYTGVGIVFQGSQYLLYRRELVVLRGIAESMKIGPKIEEV